MKIAICSALGVTLVSFMILAGPSRAIAQEAPPPIYPPMSNEELARKAQNPISNLTSALVENNSDFGVGPSNGLENILNLEEFYPLRIAKYVRFVQRFIVPVIGQPELSPGEGGHGGLGDIQYQAYFTSVNTKGFIFGVGPILSIPLAYPKELGSGKWSLGPTAAALVVKKDWVGGLLVNQLWSFTNYNDRPSVSRMLLQPFVYLNLSGAWYLASSPVMTADWKVPVRDQWTIPLGGGVGKVFKVGKQGLSTEVQAFDDVVSPQGGPDWSVRIRFQILFPPEKENKPTL